MLQRNPLRIEQMIWVYFQLSIRQHQIPPYTPTMCPMCPIPISQMAQLKLNIYRIGKTDRFGCEGCNITADRWAIENHVCSSSRIENNFHQGINTLESDFI